MLVRVCIFVILSVPFYLSQGALYEKYFGNWCCKELGADICSNTAWSLESISRSSQSGFCKDLPLDIMTDKAKLQNIVLASFVADAASMGTHWIYDPVKLHEILGDEGSAKPEFHEPPACPYYSSNEFPGHYANGQLSPYGEQAYALLEYVAEKDGLVSGEDFASYFYDWTQSYTGRLDHATKLFIDNVKSLKSSKKSLYPNCGADDNQAQASFKVPAIALKYLGTENYLNKAEEAIRAHQNNNVAVDFGLAFARLLASILLGGLSMDQAIAELKSTVSKDVWEATDRAWNERTAVKNINKWDDELVQFGRSLSHELYDKHNPGKEKTEFRNFYALSCPFPQSYIVALKIVGDTIETMKGEDFRVKGFEFGVRRNSLIGGDNCGRSCIVAGLLTALGAEVPPAWREKFQELPKVQELIQSII